jgi:ankyrin repeat protein
MTKKTDPKATGQLLVAIERGDAFECWNAVHDGADVNATLADNLSVIQKASWCTKSRLEIVKFLLGCGADVDGMGGVGRSALALAATRDAREICYALIEAGAGLEVRLTDQDHTALGAAAYNGRPELFRSFVERGADLYAPHRLASGDVFTPLQLAARMGETEIVRYCLVDLGMDPNCKTKNGRTLTQLASKHEAIKELVMVSKTEVAIQGEVSAGGDEMGSRGHLAGPSL